MSAHRQVEAELAYEVMNTVAESMTVEDTFAGRHVAAAWAAKH